GDAAPRWGGARRCDPDTLLFVPRVVASRAARWPRDDAPRAAGSAGDRAATRGARAGCAAAHGRSRLSGLLSRGVRRHKAGGRALLAGYHRERRHRVARGRGGDRVPRARTGRAARAPGGPDGHSVRAAPRVVLPAAIRALEARSRIDGEPRGRRRADRARHRIAHAAFLRPAEHAEPVAPPRGTRRPGDAPGWLRIAHRSVAPRRGAEDPT